MSESALVDATRSPLSPPLQENPNTGEIGTISGTGTVATQETLTASTIKTQTQKIALRRRQLQQFEKAITKVEVGEAVSYPTLSESICCVTCYDTAACGNVCIGPKEQCSVITGCACNAIATPGALWTVGSPGAEYVLAKQGLAAVRTPPIMHTNGYTSCGCQSLDKPTDCLLVMTDLDALAGEKKTCKAFCLSTSTTECGYTYAEYTEELGYRADANGGSTTVIIITDGNPAIASDCSTTDVSRLSYIDAIKSRTDRLIPVGVGTEVSVGTLLTLSSGMPASMPYVTTSFGSLASALDILTTLSCPTEAPTAPPTKVPTKAPTTAKPTAVPTAQGGCTADEWDLCDKTNGMCLCGNEQCSYKRCRCKLGFGCSDEECSTCTVAPTRVPTDAPTARPSRSPTDNPSEAPTGIPTARPTYAPTPGPSKVPTRNPTAATFAPSASPTKSPTVIPTRSPTFSQTCTGVQLATCDGTNGGTCSADGSGGYQCECPDGWGCTDSACATCTKAPTKAPTTEPTRTPTLAPTNAPTTKPTKLPTSAPSEAPSPEPSAKPTDVPTNSPSAAPSKVPTFAPSEYPTPLPTANPTENPSNSPSSAPTIAPTAFPSEAPTHAPSTTPSRAPSAVSGTPTTAPTKLPTTAPSEYPTPEPTAKPTLEPSFSPTGKPSPNPTAEPSMSPTFPFGCSDDEKADCDSAVGICYCSDAVCSAKKCGCPTGWGCSDAACGTCTAAPSHAPTMEPSASPTMDPTALPTY